MEALETWPETVQRLQGYGTPSALEMADLLEAARSRWEGRVVQRTSMHDLLFTVPGDDHPLETTVRVSWNDDDVVELQLAAQGLLVTADRCRRRTAPAVLNAFLVQLVGGDVVASPPESSSTD